MMISDKQFSIFPVLLIGCLIAILGWQTGLGELWIFSEEYGHGLMVFVVLLLAIYQRRSEYSLHVVERTFVCNVLGLISAFMVIVGLLSGINILAMYGMLLFLVTLIIAYGGISLLNRFLVPLAILLLLIPLPNPFGPMLTAKLQLLSSQLGVYFIRLFGGTVYLEGNVIEMGTTTLMVAEACAGLRYLFPLMSLGAIIAFTLDCNKWLKWVVFLLTIPITILLNSLRIAVTGFLTEHYGKQHTEGFLHFFEGWVVFVLASVILMLSVTLLLKLSGKRNALHPLFELFNVDWSRLKIQNIIPLPLISAMSLIAWLTVAMLAAFWLSHRVEIVPARESFTQFPLQLKDWQGNRLTLSSVTESVSAATEYLYVDYVSHEPGEEHPVNLYVAYYDSQKHGNIPHSPKVCMPGDGWKITGESVVRLTSKQGRHWLANRLVIQKGAATIVSYYWIQQGKAAYTSEYQARLGLIPRSFIENRTDGALFRIHSVKAVGESDTLVDQRMQKLVFDTMDLLQAFVPH